jgi:hypothetical protein
VSQNAADDIATRLGDYKYSAAECRAAIHGKRVPYSLGLSLIRLCIIRGIRYHAGFGEELRGVLPAFTRALNARSIMSDRIPDMSSDAEADDVPYCIWHPQTASEATYRELVHRYPRMVYHVGRACAVAGYTDLYKELEILPDVHIAEEARECGSMAIYDDIMSRPVRYDVMNDYECIIGADPRSGVHLNGDTAVCRSLDVKQKFRTADKPDSSDFWDRPGFKTNIFDLTEDMNIDDHDTPGRIYAAPEFSGMSLLFTPLPADLPTVDKDLLILMAAYSGDIDRYARLRRPKPLENKIYCCVRGIYHNSMFALWWAGQEHSPRPL